MEIQNLYKIFLQHTNICTDTRKITPGCIFFALKGPNFNGNQFAKKALELGASYCVVDEFEQDSNPLIIVVDDVLKTLQQLANYHRKQLNTTVIAIVGSNGKTTTKELLFAIFSRQYNTLATPGNFNNHIGLPLTLLQLTPEHQFAIIEMGANHIGENALLCEIAEPDCGLVTNNGMDHLEGFGDIEGVAKSNSELYYHLLQNNKTAFVNANDEWLMRMATRLNHKFTYAANTNNKQANANYMANAITLQPEITFTYDQINFTSWLSGDYNFDNIMAALCIGKHFAISTEKIAKGIASYQPKNNRSQWINKGNNIIFMDAYNANPSSMEAALKNFAAFNHPNKWVFMGDMFEMGNYAAQEHQRMVELAESLNFEQVFIVGDNFYTTTNNTSIKLKTTEEAINYLQQNKPTNKAVFLKASRGMQLEKLLDLME